MAKRQDLPVGLPGVVHQAVTITSGERGVFALRDDGAVFVLLRRGEIWDGKSVEQPRWLPAPAVPGTVAALEREG